MKYAALFVSLSTCLSIPCDAAFFAAAVENDSVFIEQDEDPLLTVLNEYSGFLLDLRQSGENLTDEIAVMWIAEISNLVEGSSNVLVMQSGLVAIMSLHNQMEEWEQSEQTCLQAIQIALDDSTRLMRLGDLFAIQSAMDMEFARFDGLAERWKTFEKLDELLRNYIKTNGLDQVEPSAFNLYRWAAEEKIRLLFAQEKYLEAAAQSDWLLEIFGSPLLRTQNPIGRHVIRHYRSLSASIKLGHDDVLGAMESLRLGEIFSADVEDAAMAYGLSGGISFATASKFVMSLNWDEYDDLNAIDLAVSHARRAMDYLRDENEGYLQEGLTVIDSHDVVLAFLLLEEVVSPMLEKEPGLFERVPLSMHLPSDKKALLKVASKLLVDFLVLDGQNETASQYILLMKQKFTNVNRD